MQQIDDVLESSPDEGLNQQALEARLTQMQ